MLRPLLLLLARPRLRSFSASFSSSSYVSRVFPSLSNDDLKILERERVLLSRVGSALSALSDTNNNSKEKSTVEVAKLHLDERFCVTIVGEFNAGKSTFINAIAGERVCREGVTPTTNAVQILRYKEKRTQQSVSLETPEQFNTTNGIDLDWLEGSQIVDTPGTNAIIAGHQRITEDLIPRSDLILFVTSVERPFSESERLFMHSIHQWRRKIVIVVNKIDSLAPDTFDADLSQVVGFVRENALKLLESTPRILPVSSRLALEAKINSKRTGSQHIQHDSWKRSRFGELESYIRGVLGSPHKVRLKLEAALGVVDRVTETLADTLRTRQKIADEDQRTLLEADALVKEYDRTSRKCFALQLVHIENVMLRLLHRTEQFLAAKLRFSAITSLLSPQTLQRQFEEEVVRGFGSEVEEAVANASHWLSGRNFVQTQELSELLISRSRNSSAALSVAGLKLSSGRQRLAQELQTSARELVERYNGRGRASEGLALAVRTAAVSTLALHASALGLGALTATAAATAGLTGVAGAGALAVAGLAFLPVRREQLKRRMRSQIESLQHEIELVAQQHLERELASALHAFQESLRPYTKLLEEEKRKLLQGRESLGTIRKEANEIRNSITELYPPETTTTKQSTTLS